MHCLLPQQACRAAANACWLNQDQHARTPPPLPPALLLQILTLAQRPSCAPQVLVVNSDLAVSVTGNTSSCLCCACTSPEHSSPAAADPESHEVPYSFTHSCVRAADKEMQRPQRKSTPSCPLCACGGPAHTSPAAAGPSPCPAAQSFAPECLGHNSGLALLEAKPHLLALAVLAVPTRIPALLLQVLHLARRHKACIVQLRIARPATTQQQSALVHPGRRVLLLRCIREGGQAAAQQYESCVLQLVVRIRDSFPG